MENIFKMGDRVKLLSNETTKGFCNISIGKVYTVTGFSGKCIYVDNMNASYSAKHFILADTKEKPSPMELIGKDVKTNGTTVYKVTGVTMYNLLEEDRRSLNCNEYYKNNGKEDFVVLMLGRSANVPYDAATLYEKPKEATVILNENYRAIVSKELIKVGCQTFPVSILKDLEKALKSLD